MNDVKQELNALKRTIFRLRTLHTSPRPSCRHGLSCECDLATDIRTLGDIWRRLDDAVEDEEAGDGRIEMKDFGQIFENGIERIVAAIGRGTSL